jgi:hypothetical protein
MGAPGASGGQGTGGLVRLCGVVLGPSAPCPNVLLEWLLASPVRHVLVQTHGFRPQLARLKALVPPPPVSLLKWECPKL